MMSTTKTSPRSIEPTTRRSRSGCWTCRSRTVKKKCDQQQPVCGRCDRLGLDCDYSQRPSLAERRRAQNSTDHTHSNDVVHETTTFSPLSTSSSPSPSLSIVKLSEPVEAPCSFQLSNADHEAIRHFRTQFGKSHHVKNTDYSLISLMFNIAKENPMVMHMVLAMSLKEMNTRRLCPESIESQSSLQHYSLALRSMADAVSPRIVTKDLDAIYTALWMMLVWEQQFGDSKCAAYVHHLEGISSLLQHQSDAMIPSRFTEDKSNLSKNLQSQPGDNLGMSVYSARILIWIALLDAGAASSGIGGQVNAAILNTLFKSGVHASIPSTDPMEAFAGLRRYSGPLYRMAWGDTYPQKEMVDDVENQDVYALLAGCVQLRFMTAQLAKLYHENPAAVGQKVQDVENAINQTGSNFKDLFDMACNLSLEVDNNHSLVANLRAVVPMYHAIFLDFMRLTTFVEPLGEVQRYSIREILKLTFQGYRYGGDETIIKVAWPLFIAALETDDLLHQDWILERFEAISRFGRNFQRAHDFLRNIIPLQQRLGKRVDVREQMRKSSPFVLG